jgi:hypothetical protein
MDKPHVFPHQSVDNCGQVCFLSQGVQILTVYPHNSSVRNSMTASIFCVIPKIHNGYYYYERYIYQIHIDQLPV